MNWWYTYKFAMPMMTIDDLPDGWRIESYGKDGEFMSFYYTNDGIESENQNLEG